MTQSPIFSLSLIRELRGSPLTVLIAILLLEQGGQIPVTAQALKDTTGYKDHTITDSLRILENPTRQFIVRITGGWRISSGFQLPLTFQDENRDIRGFDVSSCSSSNRKSKEIVNGEEQEIIEIRDIRDSDAFRANYKKALALGIRDPKASLMAALPNVTPDYIQAHVDQIKDDGHPLGTAIYRILHGWSIEIDEKKAKAKAVAELTAKATGHKPGCECIDCTMNRLGLPLCPTCHHIYQNCECPEETT